MLTIQSQLRSFMSIVCEISQLMFVSTDSSRYFLIDEIFKLHCILELMGGCRLEMSFSVEMSSTVLRVHHVVINEFVLYLVSPVQHNQVLFLQTHLSITQFSGHLEDIVRHI